MTTSTIAAYYIASRYGYWIFNIIGCTPIVISMIILTVLHIAIMNPYKTNLLKDNQILNKKHVKPNERREKRKQTISKVNK